MSIILSIGWVVLCTLFCVLAQKGKHCGIWSTLASLVFVSPAILRFVAN